MIADAQNKLSVCYMKGLGIKRDIEKAIMWGLKAAKQGNAEARSNVADWKKQGLIQNDVDADEHYDIFYDLDHC